jgi:hypothetical protein
MNRCVEYIRNLFGTSLIYSSDDRQALIWDITVKARPIEDPILAFSAGGEINQLQV